MIEVDYKKVPQFFLERRKLKEDWATRYKALKLSQRNLNEKEMNYMQCVQYVDSLKQDAQKNVFGQYTSKIINQWISLLKLFEKDNLHAVDLGKALTQLNQYEMYDIYISRPGLKKQLLNIDSQISNLQQRINDYKQSIIVNQANYEIQCTKLGIKGEDIDSEVPNMITQIPEIYDSVNTKIYKSNLMLEALNYYREFTLFQHQPREQILSTLEQMINEGNKIIEQQQWEVVDTEIDWTKYMEPQVSITESTLSDIDFRNRLIKDLVEIQYFLKLRSTATEDMINVNNSLVEVPKEQLIIYLNYIEDIIAQLTSQKLQQLLMLTPKNQQRIINQLRLFRDQTQKLEYNIKQSLIKIEDLKAEQSKCQQLLQNNIEEVKDLQNYTQQLLRDIFKAEIKVI